MAEREQTRSFECLTTADLPRRRNIDLLINGEVDRVVAPGEGFEASAEMTGPDACAIAGMRVAGPPSLGALNVI